MSLFKHKGPAIGIDLGTTNILVYVRTKGVVVKEPLVIAVDAKTQKIVAVGHRAKTMKGRTHAGIKVIQPIRDGVVADFTATSELIQFYVKELTSNGIVNRKPLILIATPTHLTSVERRAVKDAALQAGAKEAVVVVEIFAAAIGAGLPVWDPTGSMIVDIGGGTTEVAIISLGGIVVSDSIKIADDEMDRLILKHVKARHRVLIGDTTAEQIKMHIFTAEQKGKMAIRGRDLVTGLPRTIEITADEIEEALKETIDQITRVIKQTLELTPPELASDIIDRGLLLSGGVALLPELVNIISEATHLPVILADNPLENVVMGTAKLIEAH